MKCKMCKNYVDKTMSFCPYCSHHLNNKRKKSSNEVNNKIDDNSKVKGYLLVFYSFLTLNIVSFLFSGYPTGLICTVISIVVAKIKFPNNSLIKTLFWIIVIIFILFLIYAIYVIIMCNRALQSCPD